MHQCPYCGSQLQENAQFCLYCMRPLQVKTDIIKMQKGKKGLWLLVGIIALVVIAAIILVTVLGNHDNISEGDGDADSLFAIRESVLNDQDSKKESTTNKPAGDDVPTSEADDLSDSAEPSIGETVGEEPLPSDPMYQKPEEGDSDSNSSEPTEAPDNNTSGELPQAPESNDTQNITQPSQDDNLEENVPPVDNNSEEVTPPTDDVVPPEEDENTPEDVPDTDTPVSCDHDYVDATCTAPMTCSVCGATAGSANGHQYSAATCTVPKTCTVCGTTTGSANGHNYGEATCTSPSQCSVCGRTNGSALGHQYDATGFCSACNKTIWLTQAVQGGVEITGLDETLSTGVYQVPSAIDGYMVVGIGNSAFYNDRTMKSIYLPDTITYIGDKAFYGVDGLTTITIPSSVRSIGLNAFMECAYLSEIYIASTDISINNNAFSGMYNREVSLTIYAPASVLDTWTVRVNWDAAYVEWNG